MKWILMVFANLIIFSGFAQECSWNGAIGRRDQIENLLYQKAKEKLDSFLLENNIIRTEEDPMSLETLSPLPVVTNSIGIKFHYKFKTKKGSEISTDPSGPRNPEDPKNDFGDLMFKVNIIRDAEGYFIKKICEVRVSNNVGLPLFNLSLEDYFITRIYLATDGTQDNFKLLEFEIPNTPNLD
ncbi:MAG: hypothetical protein ACHQYQ_07290 [Bacteriovoracales bacterium]